MNPRPPISAETMLMTWGVPLVWARLNPAIWEPSVRDWVRWCRASGLTVITAEPSTIAVVLTAMRPGYTPRHGFNPPAL